MGVRLGRYVVLKHIASGGMADVLLGRSEGIEGFERHVVVKRIRPELARDHRFIRMFLDEARLAATLHHQHIVQVHDVGESGGEYFIAMEYIHGEDVRAILSAAARRRSHVPLGCAIAFVSAAAAGLHYAHERRGSDRRSLGIVHRDVSPSNILVGYDGAIKVVDFGIAKATARADQDTRSCSLKGKIAYMAPEQCRGAAIDRRSDVYALGVVLHELLTTTRLFRGDNDYLVMDQIVNGRISAPHVRRPDLPAELSAIAMRALAVDPARRYATADELRAALDQFASRAGITASTSTIASYLRAQFGDRPEPWLELAGDDGQADPGAVAMLASARTETFRTSGGSAPGSPRDPVDGSPGLRADRVASVTIPRATAAIGELHARGAGTASPAGPTSSPVASAPPPAPAPTVPAEIERPPAPHRTGTLPTDAKLAWESRQRTRAPRAVTPPRLALVGAPAAAVLALAAWQLTPGASRVQATAAGPMAAPAAPRSTALAAKPVDVALARGSPPPVAPVAAFSEPAAPLGAQAPGAAAGLPWPELSRDLIAKVVSDHSSGLAACDAQHRLRGDVMVRFLVDASGQVRQPQVAGTMAELARGCIRRNVQTWRFPPPGAGGAHGSYTLSFQLSNGL